MLQHVGDALLDFSHDVRFMIGSAPPLASGRNAMQPSAIRWPLRFNAISLHLSFAVCGSINSDVEQICPQNQYVISFVTVCNG
jgi:hypothetical protein